MVIGDHFCLHFSHYREARRNSKKGPLLPRLLAPEELEIWLDRKRLHKKAKRLGTTVEALLKKREQKGVAKSLPVVIPTGKRGPMGEMMKKKSKRKVCHADDILTSLSSRHLLLLDYE